MKFSLMVHANITARPFSLGVGPLSKVTTEKLNDIVFPQAGALRRENGVPRGDSASLRGREGLVDHQFVGDIAFLERIREHRDGRGRAIVFRHHEQGWYR